MADLPWKEAIEQVLTESGEAMHYADIASRTEELGLRTTLGATPANSVATTLSLSIRHDPNTPFYKAGKSLYGLIAQQAAPPAPVDNANVNEANADDPNVGDAQAGDADDGNVSVIQALGMFWLRDHVLWKNAPSILGRQQLGSDPVDFAKQRGIYLLHDRRDVIYVGRSTDRPLGQRLYEHTIDRLSGRWDRFSWFGLYPVAEDGTLTEAIPDYEGDPIISALESVMIESLEPPLNRRRGDNLNAVEFMQALDPAIEQKRTEAILQQALARVKGT